MKIFNYSDKPVVINGHAIEETEITLKSDIRKPWVTHDGYQFLSNQNTESRLETITILNSDSSGYKYQIDELELPDIYMLQIIIISCVSFLMLIKLIQKLKTR